MTDVAAFDATMRALVGAEEVAAGSCADAETAFDHWTAATGCFERFLASGVVPSGVEAVRGFREVVARVPGSSQFRAGALADLLAAIMSVQQATARTDLLEYAVTLGREGVSLDENGRAAPATALRLRSNLAAALVLRAELSGDALEIDEAIQVGIGALHLPGVSFGDLAPVAITSARAFLMRFRRNRDPRDIESTFGLLRPIHATPGLTGELSGHAYLVWADALIAAEETDVGRSMPGDLFDLAIRGYRTAAASLPDSNSSFSARLRAAQTEARWATMPYRLHERPAAGYWEVRGSDLAKLDEAIDELRTCAGSAPVQYRAATLGSLASALRDRGMLTSSPDDASAAQQVQARAATAIEPGTADHARMLNNLGLYSWEVWRNGGQDPDMLAATVRAWEQADEVAFAGFLGAPVATKLADADTWQGMRVRLVDATVELANADPAGEWEHRAVEHAEAAKAALLRGLVGRGRIAAPGSIEEAEIAEERELLDALNRMDRAELSMRGTGDRTPLAANRRRVVTRLRERWAQWEQRDADAKAYVRLRRGDRLDWTGIAALAGESESERAVLSLFCAPKRLIAAVVRNGSSGPRICTVPMTTTALADLMSTYRLEVDRFGVEFGAETWDVPLQPLLTAVRENLDGVSELVVSPHGALHLLPWPALLDRAWSGLGSAPVVVVEPSLSVLAALQTPPPADVHGAAVFGDPLGDLRFSRREANRVAALLDVTPAIGDQATRRAVVDALKSAATVHIAAHVQTETTDPLESGLLLADGRLTARDILTEHLHAELVVLSACDSGRGASGGGDEFLGLTYALLQAGVRTLVVSLWPVEDQVTEELMVALHTYRRTSPTVAAALRKASTQIRTKRSHSWYWGAFVTVGRADLNRQVVE